jgi:hypothetical protein
MSENTEKSHGRKESHCDLFEDRTCKLREGTKENVIDLRITGIEEEIGKLPVKIRIIIK